MACSLMPSLTRFSAQSSFHSSLTLTHKNVCVLPIVHHKCCSSSNSTKSKTRHLEPLRTAFCLKFSRFSQQNMPKSVTNTLPKWKRENIYTIPNLLCSLRIVATPFIVFSLTQAYYSVSLSLFAVAGASDVLDGFIARNFPSQRSNFGSIIDPIADKTLVGFLFLTLSLYGHIPMTLFVLTIMKDLMLLSSAFYIRWKTLPGSFSIRKYFDPTMSTVSVDPSVTGKLNMGLQLALISASLASLTWPFASFTSLVEPLIYITFSTTIVAGIEYAFEIKSTLNTLTKEFKS